MGPTNKLYRYEDTTHTLFRLSIYRKIKKYRDSVKLLDIMIAMFCNF